MTDVEQAEEEWRPSKLSYSMAGTYQQCPRKWKYQYILGERVGTTIPAMIGSFAHEVLEYLYQEEPQKRTLETAKDISTYLWPTLEEDEHFIQHQLTEEEAIDFKKTVWTNIAGLFQMEDPTTVEVVATEQKLVVEIDGTPFGGVVDRIDKVGDTFEVVDYKTGKPGDQRYWPKKLKQVQLYAAMIRAEFGYTPTRVRLKFPSHKQDVDQAVTNSSMSKVVTELSGVWNDIHKSIDKDDFAPSVGPLCAWCDFVLECPEGQKEALNRWNQGRVREDAPVVKLMGLT